MLLLRPSLPPMLLVRQALMPSRTASTNSLQIASSDKENDQNAPIKDLICAVLPTDQHVSLQADARVRSSGERQRACCDGGRVRRGQLLIDGGQGAYMSWKEISLRISEPAIILEREIELESAKMRDKGCLQATVTRQFQHSLCYAQENK